MPCFVFVFFVFYPNRSFWNSWNLLLLYLNVTRYMYLKHCKGILCLCIMYININLIKIKKFKIKWLISYLQLNYFISTIAVHNFLTLLIHTIIIYDFYLGTSRKMVKTFVNTYFFNQTMIVYNFNLWKF